MSGPCECAKSEPPQAIARVIRLPLAGPQYDDCPSTGSVRPCRVQSCRHNLSETSLNNETCALDVANEGGVSLQYIADTFGTCRERVRQIETRALRRPGVRALLEAWADHVATDRSSPLAQMAAGNERAGMAERGEWEDRGCVPDRLDCNSSAVPDEEYQSAVWRIYERASR